MGCQSFIGVLTVSLQLMKYINIIGHSLATMYRFYLSIHHVQSLLIFLVNIRTHELLHPFFFNISRRSAVEVLHIFHRHGPPSKERAYLFNGDISDRGAEAGQTMLRVDAVLVVGKTTKKSK